MHHLRVGGQVCPPVDLGNRHVVVLERRHQLAHRPPGQLDLEDLHQGLRVDQPVEQRGEARVREQVVAADGPAGPLELGVLDHDAREPAVGGPPHPVEAGELGHLPRVVDEGVVVQGLGPQPPDGRVHHCQLDVLAPRTPLAGEQRGRHRLGRVDRAQLVAGDGLEEGRRAIGVTLHVGDAGDRLDDRVVHPLGRVRPVRPEPADRQVDDPRVHGPHRCVAEPHAIDRTGPEALHEHVGVTGTATT
ncbi:MAG: hypothetical protein IPM45_04560 [Acidimicrobiales bacterium]|nr:hypothetical protein [Acidimicrobiales bacterium]